MAKSALLAQLWSPLSVLSKRLVVAVVLLAGAHAVSAEILYSQVRSLPPLPDDYEQLDDDARIQWLQRALEVAPSDVERYRLHRTLFSEFFYLDRRDEARRACEERPPLREDIFYRERCILIGPGTVADWMSPLVDLAQDARQQGNAAAAAQVLADLAWEQSKAGDVGTAFASYESALAMAPSDDAELLGTLMMDTATAYIVNGDQAYVQRGIALLEQSRAQTERALAAATDPDAIALLRDNILLTHFNTGIAYALHLYDYARAVDAFAPVNRVDGPYQPLALTFSALSLAKLGDLEQSKALLQRARSLPPGFLANRPEVRGYLACYQQLAERHWRPEQTLPACRSLDPNTRLEVQLDVYRRLADDSDPSIELDGLRALKTLFFEKLEPQLQRRASAAASNTELARLQRESDLKSVVLAQQEALQEGREQTYVQRQRFLITLAILLVAVALLIASRLRQKQALADQYERLSVRDPLTKLGNRRFLEQQIERELAHVARARRTDPQAALGILVFDVDHFKKVNDTYGHNAGDAVLVEMSKRITLATRDTDLLVRWGGEEFLLVARVDGSDRIGQLAARVVQAVAGLPFDIPGHEPLPVTCTVGAVRFPFIDTNNLEVWTRLVSLADAALYYGKALGRNGWVVIHNEHVASLEDIDGVLARPLTEALDAGIVSVSSSFDRGGG